MTFTLNWENTGTVALDSVEILDDIMAQFGGQFIGATIDTVTTSGTATVTANAAWGTADTSPSLITHTGDDLAVGDTIQVVFTVTIDPDASGTSSGGLENQATSTGTGVNPDTGMPDPDLLASDVSDNGADPLDENGEDNGDGTFGNDPTPIIIPDISVVKAVSGTPTPLANGNFEVVYELVIENTGNVDLANISLIENLASQFGTALISAGNITLSTAPSDPSSNIVLDTDWDGDGTIEIIDQVATTLLAIGDSFVVQFTTEIDPDAVGAPGTLNNQASVGGDAVDENGDPILGSDGMTQLGATDNSDSGADPNGDNPDAPGDMGTTDDPTPLLIPDLGLAKAASDAVPNGENFDVTFTFIIENNGTVDMANLSLTDDIMAEFGNAFVSATAPTVANFVGTGTAPGANAGWASNSTQDLLDGTGQLNIGDSFEVSFTVTIDPDGIDSVSQALENQGTISGDGINPDTGLPDPALFASDDSDNGADPDGVLDDATPVIIADIGVAKQVVGTPIQLANGNYESTYQVVVENTGTVDLANLTIVENIASQFGGAYVNAYGLTLITPPADASSMVTLDSAGFNGGTSPGIVDASAASLLAVGDSFVFQFSVEIDLTQATATLENTVTAGGDAVDENGNPLTDASGDPITATDNSDSGTDGSDGNPGAPGDSGGTDDPTPLLIPEVGLAKSAGDAVPNGDNFDVTFTFIYENTGNVDLTNLTLFDDIAAEFGNAFVGVVPGSLAIQNFVGTGTAPGVNAAWAGDTSLNLLDGTGQANIDDTFEVVFTVTIDPDGIDGVSQGLENQGTAGGVGINPDTGAPDPSLTATDDSDNGTDPNGGDDPTPIIIADVSVAKEVFGTPIALPDGTFEVTYQLVVENTGTVDLANLSLVDNIAAQFGAPFVSAGGLTLVTPPADAGSSVAIDSSWDGSANAEMIDQAAATSLAIGDSYVVQFNVIVDLDAGGTSGPLNNQAVTGGDAVDENGNQLTDSSGNPITASDDSDSGSDPNGDNPGDQGDMGTTDDPTPLLIPDIAIAKSAGAAVANGDNWDVTFTLLIENTGTVTLDNLSVFDDIAAEFGNAFVTSGGVAIQNFTGTGTAPTANGDWAGDTTQNMVVGGILDVGDSFEVIFTVTIDPDGIDSVSQGLNNQATAGGDGVNPDGTPLGVSATDDSDNGTDPNGENGEDDMDGIAANDPTPILIADLGLAKSVVGTPTLLSNGNFNVTYQLVVENTGTVDLANLSLTDDLAAQFGAGLISAGGLTITSPPTGLNSSIALNPAWDGTSVTELVDGSAASLLEIGDSFTLEFTVEVDSAALSPLPTTNTISGNGDGVDENGDPIIDPNGNPLVAMDDSDSGTDASGSNIGEPGDSFGSDDPTPLYLPSISVAKSAGDAIPNGDNFDVTFTLLVGNDGNVDLSDLTLFDDIATEFGAAFVSVGNVAIQNFNGSGTAPTVNAAWTGDTSQTIISGGQANVGDTFEVVFTVTIDPDATGTSMGLNNQATAGGAALDSDGNPLTNPDGTPLIVTDDSDNGTALDENGEEDTVDGIHANDPTPVQIADLAIAKTVFGEPVLTDIGNFVVTYELVIENTGTVTLGDLSLLEDLASQFGSAYVDAGNLVLITGPSDPISDVAVNSAAWNGGSSIELMDPTAANILAVGDSFTIHFDVEINPANVSAPLINQVVGEGDAIDANGDPIATSSGAPLVAMDESDSGVDPGSSNPSDPADQGTQDDPTPFDPPPVPTSQISGTVFQDDNGDGIQQPGEAGIEGVEITLTGTDVLGNPVEITVLTDANGNYVFDGLNAGTYSVTQTQPEGFDDGVDNGDSSFTISNDQFSDIELGFGEAFTSNTFAERLPGASGNPPRLPGLPPIQLSPIGRLLNSFAGGPGPITLAFRSRVTEVHFRWKAVDRSPVVMQPVTQWYKAATVVAQNRSTHAASRLIRVVKKSILAQFHSSRTLASGSSRLMVRQLVNRSLTVPKSSKVVLFLEPRLRLMANQTFSRKRFLLSRHRPKRPVLNLKKNPKAMLIRFCDTIQPRIFASLRS